MGTGYEQKRKATEMDQKHKERQATRSLRVNIK